jgi:hypothetical protein
MRPAAPTFAGKYQIRTFGNNYEVSYDTILDHDTYSFLRVSLEIPREEKDAAVLVLNGKEVGIIRTVRNAKGVVIGFAAYRNKENPTVIREEPFEFVGQAAAAIITHQVA